MHNLKIKQWRFYMFSTFFDITYIFETIVVTFFVRESLFDYNLELSTYVTEIFHFSLSSLRGVRNQIVEIVPLLIWWQ